MCGIAGIIGSGDDVIREAVGRMNASQVHRGPDGEGAVVVPFGAGQWVGLGHRRLSIIDLSPTGAQPMVNPETQDVLTYNGEIYNFRELRRQLESEGARFRGRSDSEALLHALSRWGTDALEKLEGMYAFAFLDRRRNELILARDPLGIKPLYYTCQGGRLVFASEVRAILSSGLVDDTINGRAVCGFLAHGSVQSPETIVRGVMSLEPGSFLAVSGASPDRPRVVQYWDFPEPDPSLDSRAAEEAVAATLEQAVRSHLVSDVPVGVFLSSGLDSTTVATMASRAVPDLHTFTVGFEDDAELCEVDVASETARRLGVHHSNIMISPAESLDWMERWLDCMDQPSMDGFNVYIISRAVKQAGITVALSGQGGDELFGGYSSFRYVPWFHRMHRYCRFLPASVKRSLAWLGTAGRPASLRQKVVDMAGSDGSLLSLYLGRRRALSDGQMREAGLGPATVGLTNDYIDPVRADSVRVPEADPVAAVSILESQFYLNNTLLRDGDCYGMSQSLEIRVPFLDKRVIELMYRIPGTVRLPNGRADKHLLRRTVAAEFGPSVLEQQKKGFMLPIGKWLMGPLKEVCLSSLDHLKGSGYLEPRGVDSVWETFCREPDSPIWSRVWEMCVLGYYLESHARRGSAQPALSVQRAV